MIRARAAIVDRMIEDEAHRVRALGGHLTYWGFGGGFDARWYRLRPTLRDVIGEHYEVDDPEVLEFKDQVLADSSFAGAWDRIRQHRAGEDRWGIPSGDAPHVLVVLEGVATRIGADGLKRLLGRIRRDAPHAHVVADLPGIVQPPKVQRAIAVGSARSRWSSPQGTGASALTTRELRRLGWRPTEDLWFAARPELRAPSGMAVCSGMEALRVMMLEPTEG